MDRLSNDDLKRFFAGDTLFGDVSESGLTRIVDLANQTFLKRGDALFLMGQNCDALHFVVTGTALLMKTSTEGRQRVLHRAVPGEMVGAVPFFDGHGYPATFTAETDCLVVRLPREGLLELLRKDSAVALSLLGGVVKRLRLMSALVEQLSFEDTTHRLWSFLVRESTPEIDGKKYPRVLERLPTREHIADSIGTVREVVSRRLSALVESGKVRIDGRRLVLLEPME